MAEVHHLSQATYDRLSAELEDLTTTSRIDIARKIQAARELGDLSENGDYHAAKEEQGKMEARIRHLQALLLDAEIVEAAGTDSVSPGHVVAIRYEGDDDAERFLIGSIEEQGGDARRAVPGLPPRAGPDGPPASGDCGRVRIAHRRPAEGRDHRDRGLSLPDARGHSRRRAP